MSTIIATSRRGKVNIKIKKYGYNSLGSMSPRKTIEVLMMMTAIRNIKAGLSILRKTSNAKLLRDDENFEK